jgi:hypothetical protein
MRLAIWTSSLSPAANARRPRHEEVKQAIGRYAGLVPVDRPHLRLVANYDEDSFTHRLHRPVVGRRLLAEGRRSGSAHPLVSAGFCGADPAQLEANIEGLNIPIGQQGRDTAYPELEGRVGVVPDYFWLDTRQRPNR